MGTQGDSRFLDAPVIDRGSRVLLAATGITHPNWVVVLDHTFKVAAEQPFVKVGERSHRQRRGRKRKLGPMAMGKRKSTYSPVAVAG